VAGAELRVLLVGDLPGSGGSFGTERVMHSLAEHLPALGVETRVVAHLKRGKEDLAGADDLVAGQHGLPAVGVPSKAQFYQVRNEAPGFVELIGNVQPDVVQFHGFAAAGTNRRHLEIAQRYGCRTVLWHNVPAITCLQTGLLRKGGTPCDGEIRVTRCTECRLRASGVPTIAAWISARAGVGKVSKTLPPGLAHIAGARWFTKQFREGTRDALDRLDAIRVGANWVREVLLNNEVPPERLHLIRPGVESDGRREGAEGKVPAVWSGRSGEQPLRLIYWGRIHRPKGVHTLWEALALAPNLDVELAIVGDADKDNQYCRELRLRAERDSRICLAGYIPSREILSVLRTADVALIPSRWHETGPITVFEARAAGLPIIGADRGGIGELCRDDPASQLFPPEDAEALGKLLHNLVSQRGLLDDMRRDVQPPRAMEQVAREVSQLYHALVR